MNLLFVYGIFLDRSARLEFGMSNPQYATVKGYATFGDYIVSAHRIDPDEPAMPDYCLTGLLVDVDPEYWKRLDALEHGYNRKIITTAQGIKAYMYTGKR